MSPLKLLAAAAALSASSACLAQEAVEAWFFLGRTSESGAWGPGSRALRLDSARDPRQVTVLRDAVLVDRLEADPAARGDPDAAEWTRVVRRGPQAIPLIEVARHDSVGKGKLVYAKVRVPAERVEVRRWR